MKGNKGYLSALLRFSILSSAICLLWACVHTVDSPPMPSEREPVVENFVPGIPESFTLSNGIRVMLVEDNELPLIQGSLYIRGGSLWEHEQSRGSVSMMGALLRNGGAGSLDAVSLDRELEQLAAEVSSSFSSEYGQISFSCLSSDVERVMDITADVVLRPRFEESRIELARLKALEDIMRRVDNPLQVAGVGFRQKIFGNSAYGRVVRSSDVRAISRKNILEAYREMVSPLDAIIAVSGNISRDRLQQVLESRFGGWKVSGPRDLTPPEAPAAGEKGIFFVKLPFQQATVMMGEVGVPRFTSDWFDILVFNEMFGAGNFASRLVRIVRSQEGLAYSIQGGISPSLGRGINSIVFQTKSESAGDAIVKSMEVLRGMQRGEFSDRDTDEFKKALVHSFVFKFDSPNEIVQRAAGQAILRFPPSYDAEYIEKVRAVNAREVRNVAEKRWHPDDFTFLVVGDQKAYESISTLIKGPLSGYNLTQVSFDEALRP